eukprot:3931607-Rhodomonas_salina.1
MTASTSPLDADWISSMNLRVTCAVTRVRSRVCGHVRGHVCGHVRGHVRSHVGGHVCGQVCGHVPVVDRSRPRRDEGTSVGHVRLGCSVTPLGC